MPFLERSSTVTRSTWCSPSESVATVRLLAPGRIAPGGSGPLLVSVEWSTRVESFRVTLRLRQDDPPGGDLRFGAADGERERVFDGSRDHFELLELHAAAPSTRAIPDVTLEVEVGEETFDAGRIAVSEPQRTVTLRGAGGQPAPASIAPDEEVELTAVAEPGGDGAFHWLALRPEALLVRPDGATAQLAEVDVEQLEELAEPARGPHLVGVVFQPADGMPDAAVVHTLQRRADLELEEMLEGGRLRFEHLQEVAFRRRLERMTPEEVAALAADPPDPRVTDYLERLGEFVRLQAAVRDGANPDRQSITFIMGDQPDSFYVGAEAFYTLNPTDQTESSLRRLDQVREHLDDAQRSGGRPWGQINIVVHADEEGGMSIPVGPVPAGVDAENRRANPRNLEAAIASGEIEPLSDELVDAGTEIFVRGCALGRSQRALELLSRAFGGDELQRPSVRAPKHLQAYEWTPDTWRPGDPGPAAAEEFYVEFFLQGFPRDMRPNGAELVRRFERDFPDVPIDWAAALANVGRPQGTTPASEERTRSASFDLEIDYFPIPANAAALAALVVQRPEFAGATNVAETDRQPAGGGRLDLTFSFDRGGQQFVGNLIQVGPAVPQNDAQRLAMFSGDADFRAELARGGRVFADFSWDFMQNDVALGGGQRRLTLEARGVRIVVRVERELREPDPANPAATRRLLPPPTDLRHFGETVPVRPVELDGTNVLPQGVRP